MKQFLLMLPLITSLIELPMAIAQETHIPVAIRIVHSGEFETTLPQESGRISSIEPSERELEIGLAFSLGMKATQVAATVLNSMRASDRSFLEAYETQVPCFRSFAESVRSFQGNLSAELMNPNSEMRREARRQMLNELKVRNTTTPEAAQADQVARFERDLVDSITQLGFVFFVEERGERVRTLKSANTYMYASRQPDSLTGLRSNFRMVMYGARSTTELLRTQRDSLGLFVTATNGCAMELSQARSTLIEMMLARFKESVQLAETQARAAAAAAVEELADGRRRPSISPPLITPVDHSISPGR